ncbi:MAG: hypothetical protein ACOC8F_01650 [Planctomycetota bacterium]
MQRARIVVAVLAPLVLWSGAAGQAPVGGSDPLEGPSEEGMDALLDEAAAARLEMERNTVAAEIRGDLLYTAEAKDKAVAILRDDPADTQADNIERICRAYAVVDDAFGEAYAHVTGGEPGEALGKLKNLLDSRQSTYRSAALHYLAAECLRKTDAYQEAVETYMIILKQMKDRISFAATSAGQAARTQEQAGRLLYAGKLYAYCLRNYGLTLSKAEYDRIYARADELAEIYDDPFDTLAERMGAVRQRLAASDSGAETRRKQDEIVTVLTDLIKHAEEQSRKGGGGGQQGGQKDQDKQKGEGEGKGKGQAAGAAGVSGGVPQQPSSPAESSFLPGGVAERPGKLSGPRPGSGAEDWAKLPPDQRRKILAAMRKLYPEKYRRLIEEYRKAMSETKDSP